QVRHCRRLPELQLDNRASPQRSSAMPITATIHSDWMTIQRSGQNSDLPERSCAAGSSRLDTVRIYAQSDEAVPGTLETSRQPDSKNLRRPAARSALFPRPSANEVHN